MHQDVGEILFRKEQIDQKIAEVGAQISKDYEGKQPVFVGILKGCFIFMADLMRNISIDCTMDFMAVSSYEGVTSTGAVKIIKDLSKDIKGRHLLLVEDVLDSGKTLAYIKKYLSVREPASIKIVTFLDKPEKRVTDITADYSCFKCPDEFIIGFGLDYNEKYRNLPYVGVLKREVYQK